MQTEWIRDAQRCAQRLLHRFGVAAAAHIRVESFAAKLGVLIVEVPLDGASAQLVRAGTRTTIMVSARITDPAARRFSIAHELGHFSSGIHRSRRRRYAHPTRIARRSATTRPRRTRSRRSS